MANQFPNHGWNGDRIAELRRLHSDGVSAGQIARQFGDVSRSAVLGKLHRLGLKRDKPSEPQAMKLRSSRSVAAQARAAVKRIARARTEPPPVAPAPIPEPPTSALVADLMALEGHHCRWPMGPLLAPALGFCGLPKAGESYCAAHDKLSRAPLKPGQPKTAAALIKALRRFVGGPAQTEAA
jgi:GcrA cell cycle regulator